MIEDGEQLIVVIEPYPSFILYTELGPGKSMHSILDLHEFMKLQNSKSPLLHKDDQTQEKNSYQHPLLYPALVSLSRTFLTM
jgi:hypothetical protein